MLVLLIDLHLHDGHPVLERHLAHLADLHTGDAYRLALARSNCLSGGELGVHRERRRLDEREAQALVVEDVARDRNREHQQHDDGGEVAGVGFDRPFHFVLAFTGVLGTSPILSGILSSLTMFLSESTAAAAADFQRNVAPGADRSVATCVGGAVTGVFTSVMVCWVSQGAVSFSGGR